MQGYRTLELEVAAFLKARGHRLLSANLDGKVVAFRFGSDAAPDVQSYFEGAEVPARELFEAHRSLRALIQQVREHDSQKNGSDRSHESHRKS